MMAPEIFEQARAAAPLHVQLMQRLPPRGVRQGAAGRIEGRIVRIFRDRDHLLHWGQRVGFSVSLIDTRSGPPMPGGTLYLDGERLGRARWLEAFLELWHGEFQLVQSQLIPLRRPTLRPVCGPDVKGFLCPGTLPASSHYGSSKTATARPDSSEE